MATNFLAKKPKLLITTEANLKCDVFNFKTAVAYFGPPFVENGQLFSSKSGHTADWSPAPNSDPEFFAVPFFAPPPSPPPNRRSYFSLR